MLSRIAFALTIFAFLFVGCSPSKTVPTQDNQVIVTPSVITPSVRVLAGTPVPFSDISMSVENAERVTQLVRWGKGILNNVTVSSDGKMLAAASSIGVYLYDTATLQEIRFIDTDTWSNAVFSPDSQLLAIFSGHDDKFQLWSISNGRLLYTFEKHTDSVTSVDFSPDGQLLASGSRDHTIHIWQVSNGTHIRSLNGHTDDVISVRFSPDGKTLATGSWDNTIRIWNVSDGVLLHTLEGQTGIELVFSSDGQLLIAQTRNGEIREIQLWNVTNGSLLANLEGWDSVFSPDGQQILTTSCTQTMDCSVLLWDKSGRLIKEITNNRPLYSAAFSPDGQYIAAGTMNDIFLFRVSDGVPIKAFEFDIPGDFSYAVDFLSFSRDGQNLISKSGDENFQHLQQWRVEDGFQVKDERFYRMDPVAFSSDGNLMAAATGDLIEIWNTSNGTIIGTLKGHTYNVKCLMFSPDNQTILAGEYSNKAHLWRLSDGMLLQTIEIAKGEQIGSISPDMQMLASTDLSGNLTLRNASDGGLVYTLTGHTDYVTDIEFSVDGKILVSASTDGTVNIWDLSNGTRISTINTTSSLNKTIDISPDGKIVAIGSYGSSPGLWRVADGNNLNSIEGGGLEMAFSPNGQMLTSIGLDDTLNLYSISDMTLLYSIESYELGELDYYPFMKFFSNGRALAVAPPSGTVRVFGVPSDNPLVIQPINIPTMPLTPVAQSESSLTPASLSATAFPATLAAASTQIACSNFMSHLQPNVKAKVATDALNIRENPGTTQAVVG